MVQLDTALYGALELSDSKPTALTGSRGARLLRQWVVSAPRRGVLG